MAISQVPAPITPLGGSLFHARAQPERARHAVYGSEGVVGVQRIRRLYESYRVVSVSLRQGLGLAAVSEARARAWGSMYSRIFVTLPFRTVMAKTQSSLNAVFVALIFPVAEPTTRTRSPCATNSGGFGYVISTSSDAFRSTSANPA